MPSATPLTNNAGLSLAMCVWLAHDDYTDGAEEFAGKNLISATSLLKPTRQIVLAPRVPTSQQQLDVADLIASRLGHAIHESVENAWKNYRGAMERLGLPDKMIEKIQINPTPELLEKFPNVIPVYLEKRAFREVTVDGHEIVISGKFDQVINGELNDTKTTSVYAFINRRKDEDYTIQGSIYRWLNPTMVTSDLMRIQHVFTDWQSFQARITEGYPKQRVIEHQVELMSLEETEAWIIRKIREILANQFLDEPDVIRCSDKDLWRSDPVYKYYADPQKAAEGGRSTKNFPNYPAAANHRNSQGKGVVVTVPGTVKACGYCPAFPICTQKNEYELDQ